MISSSSIFQEVKYTDQECPFIIDQLLTKDNTLDQKFAHHPIADQNFHTTVSIWLFLKTGDP